MKKLFLLAMIFVPCAASAQGTLAPPGAPAPTMKTLAQIEPRTPVSSLPFTISQAGSYYLTTNLTGVSGQPGVTVSAHNVTLDLAGFELAGVPGSASGVHVNGTRTNLVVRNGTLRAWGGFGIGGGNTQGGVYHDLRVFHNTAGGLSVGAASSLLSVTAGFNGGPAIAAREASVVKDSAAFSNGGVGISVLGGSTIENCTARANRNGGIDAGRDSVVLGCSATTNIGNGILVSTNSLIKDSTATRNSLDGIRTDDNCTVTHCIASQNFNSGIDAAVGCIITENTASQNLQHGIVANARCRVYGNTALNNGAFMVSGAGFYLLGDDNHIEGNNSVHNHFGYLIDGDFNLIIKNKASDFFGGGFSLNVAENRLGPVVNDAGAAGPWANFAY